MANDKNGKEIQVGDTVTVDGTVTAVSGNAVTVKAADGSTFTVQSNQLVDTQTRRHSTSPG